MISGVMTAELRLSYPNNPTRGVPKTLMDFADGLGANASVQTTLRDAVITMPLNIPAREGLTETGVLPTWNGWAADTGGELIVNTRASTRRAFTVGALSPRPITYNDPGLTAKMLPSIQSTAGNENVILSKAKTGAEDFSFFAREVPGLFLFLGGMPKGMDPEEAAPHHTPDFFIAESGMKLGVRLLCNLTLDYMQMKR